MLNRPVFLATLERVTRTEVPEALETMFFATALPGMTNPCAGQCWKVIIRFRGTSSGMFTMCLDRADARVLASAFLGRDVDQMNVEEDGLLACELANILCGAVLSRAEAGGTFELSAPHLARDLPETSDFRTGFLLDTGGSLEVGFRLAPEEAP